MPDMLVTIKLRAIIKDKKHCLALFDSNRRGDINNLETVAIPGSTIVWVLDDESGIKHISKIYSSEKESKIFPGVLDMKSPEGFVLHIPDSLRVALEAYVIEYVLEDNTRVTIDPYIRIEPPPVRGTVIS